MKKINIGIFIFLTSLLLTGCSQKKDWSYSESERTFSSKLSQIKIDKAEQISLANNEKAIRIYYDVSNKSSKKDDAYSFILDEIDSIYQDKNKLESVTILGEDPDLKYAAVDVDIAPKETKKAFVDYKVTNLTSDIKINFTNEIGGDRVATYSLKTSDLKTSNIAPYHF